MQELREDASSREALQRRIAAYAEQDAGARREREALLRHNIEASAMWVLLAGAAPCARLRVCMRVLLGSRGVVL
jgi:hypothetical protein